MCLKTLGYYETVRSLSSVTSSQRKFRSCQSKLISGFPLISAGRRGRGTTDQMNDSRSSSSFLSFFQHSLLSSHCSPRIRWNRFEWPLKMNVSKEETGRVWGSQVGFLFCLLQALCHLRSSFSVAALHAGCHLGDNRGRERGCDREVFRRSWWDGVVSGAGQHPEEHQLKGHHKPEWGAQTGCTATVRVLLLVPSGEGKKWS